MAGPGRQRGDESADGAAGRGHRRRGRARAPARRRWRGRVVALASRPPGRCGRVMSGETWMLETRGLTKRFGGLAVVDGVSIRLPAGSRTALTGANGAGKSTLLAMLSTLMAPTEGGAFIDGHSLATRPAAQRRRLGVLAHAPMLYEEFTPEENLRFFADLYGVPDAAPRIEELLRIVGLWTRRHERTEVFSRGYHQRLALARVLVHAPVLLLLDEPETGLDVEGMALLDDLLLTAPGVTVLAATHRLDRIGQWSDGGVHLERGRVVEDTTAGGAGAAIAQAGAKR
ncbi:MAG: ATP-binding cassette domain-containing protein [Dehalococcoidia bacterium]|nr:ATP-binding cassette domain-containing protein [Dehalococcoidia bacterium]